MTHENIKWVCGTTPGFHQLSIETLGVSFLKKVLGNMKNTDKVSFGQTGTGQYPNYQITEGSGAKATFRGMNHGPFNSIEAFDTDNISEEFSYQQILDTFCKVRDANNHKTA